MVTTGEQLRARGGDASLADLGYRALRRAIISCALAPGSHVTEAGLAREYGIGKSTVRVVLTRLAQDRLVQVLPREGYLVTPITLKQVQDLFEARMLIEPPIARRAAGNLSDDQLTQLRTLNAARYDPSDPESIDRLLDANTAFHMAVAAGTGNDRLVGMVGELLREMERILHFSYTLSDRNQETYHEHHELIDALAAADGDRAERLVVEHLTFDRGVVLEALLSSPGLQSVNLARG